MTKQNTKIASIAAFVLAVIALILQIVFSATSHANRALAAEIAWPVLLLIGLGLFLWGRTLKA